MPEQILIADDRFASRLMLTSLFSGAYYDVLQADRPKTVLAIARRNPPAAIVIVDIATMSPVMLCQTLRHDPAAGGCLRMIVTDRHDPARAATLIAAGADDVVSQSAPDEEVLARMRRLMDHRVRVMDLTMREDRTRPQGLAETPEGFDGPARIAIVSASRSARHWADQILAFFPNLAEDAIRVVAPDARIGPDTDVILLDGASLGGESLLRQTARLVRGQDTRGGELLVTIPQGDATLAPRALDLGAGAVMHLPFDTAEAVARIRLLIHRRREVRRLQSRQDAELQSALTDPLTGLFNRRYALPRVEDLVREARSRGQPGALLMADLDRFKRVNDLHGHLAGDAVLRSVAATASGHVVAPGFCARMGGDEILIVLPGCGQRNAQTLARRVGAAVAGRPVSLPGVPAGINVTLSIGMAVLAPGGPRTGTSAEEEAARLLHRADMALYRAKAAGRDRVATDLALVESGTEVGPVENTPDRSFQQASQRANEGLVPSRPGNDSTLGPP